MRSAPLIGAAICLGGWMGMRVSAHLERSQHHTYFRDKNPLARMLGITFVRRPVNSAVADEAGSG